MWRADFNAVKQRNGIRHFIGLGPQCLQPPALTFAQHYPRSIDRIDEKSKLAID
jgi:hypothetical protein